MQTDTETNKQTNKEKENEQTSQFQERKSYLVLTYGDVEALK